MGHRVRRAFASALLAIGLAQDALAQATSWPDKPVKLILPYAPGGATDLIGRPWADKLSQVMGQQFVIENRGGAGGMIGTEAAAKAAADGYTFLLTPNATLTILPSLRTVPYDALKSFEPVGRVGDLVCGFVIHPAVGVKNLPEMVAYAKEHPGKLAYGSAGLGTATQLRVEMLKYRAGIDILHVPYRGSADALNDLLPNTVQMMNEINVLPHVKAGKLILLNINYPTRHPDFPDVPTLTELGYRDADIPIWYLVVAPAGTPKDILAKFNATLIELAKSDDIIAKMRAINVIVPLQTPEEIRAHMVEDTKRNAELIKTANIKLE
ncbi:MAG TPA: tripartite tricarboxylate transporter substrate binding protein [Hyphomicrobiaceae bacterium]|jgi:tripartite-type tricarboxylate transporter receptor subunit TctC|nr:tripartite tricarboxylate transporter substrate binding protein [Hyphomicrobiaceae bacterium]